MIAITGATGALGRLVVDQLLERGTPADQVVAVARDPQKAADLAARGVQVREGDYDRPETLAPAFAGVDRLLLISGNEIGQRVRQHTTAIDAAETAGVGSIAYTSILKADTSTITLAAEHRATEQALAASGIPHTLLRNGWYHENNTGTLATALEHGVVLGATQGAILNPAARADFAAAAATVLTTDGHDGRTYELGGLGLGLDDVASAYTAATGTTVVHQDVPAEAYADVLRSAGLPDAVVEMLVSVDLGIARGDLATDPSVLEGLVGRPLLPFSVAVAAAVPAVA